MTDAEPVTGADYRALHEFRHQIRYFLHGSEEAARAEGLEPQQHQMLLAIRAMEEPGGPTVGKLADQLIVRHHSAVGLIDRLVERGMVERVRVDEGDRRQVRVRLTGAGEEKLERLSSVHRAELAGSGPLLVYSLWALLRRVAEGESK
jgi:DNA-binding MarR family transcriptional regulator